MSDYTALVLCRTNIGGLYMSSKEKMIEQLQRFYSLWKEGNAIYEEWAKERGLSSNSVLILYSLYEDEEICTQKSISQKWSIPKQTVNTILKDFIANDYIELYTAENDKRNKLLKLTAAGKIYAGNIIEALHERELFVIDKMGLDNVVKMNDAAELFIHLFHNGGATKDE